MATVMTSLKGSQRLPQCKAGTRCCRYPPGCTTASNLGPESPARSAAGSHNVTFISFSVMNVTARVNLSPHPLPVSHFSLGDCTSYFSYCSAQYLLSNHLQEEKVILTFSLRTRSIMVGKKLGQLVTQFTVRRQKTDRKQGQAIKS